LITTVMMTMLLWWWRSWPVMENLVNGPSIFVSGRCTEHPGSDSEHSVLCREKASKTNFVPNICRMKSSCPVLSTNSLWNFSERWMSWAVFRHNLGLKPHINLLETQMILEYQSLQLKISCHRTAYQTSRRRHKLTDTLDYITYVLERDVGKEFQSGQSDILKPQKRIEVAVWIKYPQIF
jgi:hypothetical protein